MFDKCELEEPPVQLQHQASSPGTRRSVRYRRQDTAHTYPRQRKTYWRYL